MNLMHPFKSQISDATDGEETDNDGDMISMCDWCFAGDTKILFTCNRTSKKPNGDNQGPSWPRTLGRSDFSLQDN